MYYRERKFWPNWAILSRTYELFGDKYKVWLICLRELRALEDVESSRMLVGWWVGQLMKPSVDGRRGDRSGWKLVGNSSKWERPVGETTQAGARISHYRQNQNNPHLRTQHLGIQINPWENPLVKFWRTWHQNNMRYVGFSTCMWGLCEYYHSEINKIGKVFTLVRRG